MTTEKKDLKAAMRKKAQTPTGQGSALRRAMRDITRGDDDETSESE